MNRFQPINIEWNCYNGFMFDLFYLETYKPFNLDGSLFGINFSKNYLYIDIFFMNIKIFDKTDIK